MAPVLTLEHAIANSWHFKSKLRLLQQTIDIISPIFKDMENLNQILDRPQQEIDSFIDQLKRADVVVAECMTLKYWNFLRKGIIVLKLDELQVSLLRFFKIDVQFDQARDMIKILTAVIDVHKRSLDQVDESKKMVIKDTVVDDCSVIAVSAGGCGKTKVLCGRLCIIKYDDGFILSGQSVKEYYNKGNWVNIIDPSLREHLGSYSMTKFSEIAYSCLHDDREQRPAMDIVAKELEETLKVQEAHELEEKRKHQVVKDSDSDEI